MNTQKSEKALTTGITAFAAALPKRWGLTLIAAFTAIETVAPVPIEIFVVGYTLAHLNWKWEIALFGLIGCCIGAVLAYFSGGLLFDILGAALIHHMGWEAAFNDLVQEAQGASFWSLLTLVAVAPVPFPLVSLAAGSVQYPLPLFLLILMLTRGIRFIIIAVAVAIWGEAVVSWVQHHCLKPATIAATVSAIAFAAWVAIIFGRNFQP